MPDSLAALRSCFPVAESWIYFNHAAVCPLARPVAEAVQAFVSDTLKNGSTGFREWDSRRASARARAAHLIGCQPEEIALTTSTSQGLIAVAEGLHLAPGDEIVVIQHDFPANRIPWSRQVRRGARLVEVPRDSDGRVTAQDVLAAVTSRTRVLAVPWVLFDNGCRIDLEALGQGLGDHPAFLCVDAIQGLGAFPLDVRRCRIDALSADSHKWMLGAEGIGIFYLRSERLDQVDSPLQSWTSLAHPFRRWEEGAPLRNDARRHEFATLPTALVFGLEACLGLLLDTGAEALERGVLQVSDALAEGLASRGWTVASPRARRSECSGIVAALPPSGSSEHVLAALEARAVSVSLRGGAVRFSPHAWNTVDEVGELLERLP